MGKVLFSTVFLASAILSVSPVQANSKHKAGETAYRHTEFLTEEIGPRTAGSEYERAARDYIMEQLETSGYEPLKQDFTYVRRGVTKQSSNVIGIKKGKSDKQIIVGAHYDSVAVGTGADDNASSVGVILETADALKKKNLPYTIKFVFFGAEEEGLRGSNHYASNMTPNELENTIAMINLDSLLAGDHIYVYGGSGEDGWIRDLALKIAKQRKIPLETNPGMNPEYPKGTTGDWSDHAPFQNAGIPIGYFEATNWEVGDLDGYTQTVKHGAIWHTEKDTLDFLEQEFPGRTEAHLNQFTRILTELLTDIKNEIK